MDKHTLRAKSHLYLMYDILLTIHGKKSAVADYDKLRKLIHKKHPREAFYETLALFKRDYWTLLEHVRTIAANVLEELCQAAEDAPIEPPTTPKTLFMVSANNLAYKRCGLGDSEAYKDFVPWEFIGMAPARSREEARRMAVVGLLLGFDEPLPTK